ncbi:alanine racemase [Crenobacter sp. SG2303]|uniref:Broad specificity amino-acid racemase n=1 Tax=Crenobacter oryzisoli TaxID=3056844 RepID=A0ABT7XKY0_9NEIS|nr:MULTISPECIES: alanine racemase [unclassified Crenobacter]MDN0074449.1 alanine racemase [Crenobacter sp. SG2303]MDN0081294.1 alanine racemase [Crenobacter sp. SG2305]
MKMTRTVLSLALGLAFLNGQVQAAPPLTTSNGKAAVSVAASNAWVEIDRAAFEHNIRTLQKELGGKSQICAILKADAYGHGIGLLMPTIIKTGVPCVGIASNEEARVVRASGFKGRLVRVRTATLQEINAALKYNMEELMGNAELAREAGELARRHGRTLKVHLALNSAGMSRNGVDMATEQGKQDAVAMTEQRGLKVVGVMTHFPVEDKDDVKKGLAVFNQDVDWLFAHSKLDRKKVTVHCANSFATLEVPEARLDMVRPGGALFGDTVPSRTEYQRVMQFKSRVATVNSYPAGNTVGYDRTFTLKRDSKLANIPVGYSDGYRRVFTNKGFVLIDGQRVPVVGKVSMNTLMVDVTDVPGVKAGDEVVLFGKQGKAEITQDEVENINGALLADLYTVWGNSNPKILKN